ncbi:MAG: hypothetical protein CM1200mP24_10320 [Gammaproteobacteria bacterium]|nr:MAG: hypothetical protein CM1200mP24_10320 [Gammaproteobacteria bacterium]
MRRLKLNRAASMESFFAVAQMAVAGFGHGLVPIGVAQTLGLDKKKLISLDKHGLSVLLDLSRKNNVFSPSCSSFFESSRITRRVCDG